jgi:hypothetical protein
VARGLITRERKIVKTDVTTLVIVKCVVRREEKKERKNTRRTKYLATFTLIPIGLLTPLRSLRRRLLNSSQRNAVRYTASRISNS